MISNKISFTSRTRRQTVNSDINITPFVDIVLVLLVIFMVTSQVMVGGVEVNLPKTDSTIDMNSEEPLILTLNLQDEIYLDNKKYSLEEIQSKLQLIAKYKKDLKVFIKADKNVQYGNVIKLFSILKSMNLNKVALLTEKD